MRIRSLFSAIRSFVKTPYKLRMCRFEVLSTLRTNFACSESKFCQTYGYNSNYDLSYVNVFNILTYNLVAVSWFESRRLVMHRTISSNSISWRGRNLPLLHRSVRKAPIPRLTRSHLSRSGRLRAMSRWRTVLALHCLVDVVSVYGLQYVICMSMFDLSYCFTHHRLYLLWPLIADFIYPNELAA